MSNPRSSSQPVHDDERRRASAAEVDLHAPVRAARHHRRAGVVGEDRKGPVEVRRTRELAVRRRHQGRRRRWRRCGESRRQRVGGVRRAEGERGVPDRPVAGAAAEVAAQGLEVERGRRLGPVPRAGLTSPVTVVLRRHAADEPWRAVAALRPPTLCHLALNRVQPLRAAEPLGGHDLLAVVCRGGDEARVERHPARPRAVRPRHEHRARSALTLGAPLLGAGQPQPAQEVEQRGVDRKPRQRPRRSVDGHRGGAGHRPTVNLSPRGKAWLCGAGRRPGRCRGRSGPEDLGLLGGELLVREDPVVPQLGQLPELAHDVG